MRKSLFLFLVAAFLLVCGAQAQSAGNVYGGYTFTKEPGSSTPVLNGWNLSLEGRVLPHLGLVIEGGGNLGSQNTTTSSGGTLLTASHYDYSRMNFLVGPRLSLRVGRYRPFVHAMIGASRATVTTDTTEELTALVSHSKDTTNSFSTAIGGGVDVRLLRHVDWRLQSDYLRAKLSDKTGNYRFATGVVLRF
jgi:opacity protein-like surface antigen